jgi:hypothetical protein
VGGERSGRACARGHGLHRLSQRPDSEWQSRRHHALGAVADDEHARDDGKATHDHGPAYHHDNSRHNAADDDHDSHHHAADHDDAASNDHSPQHHHVDDAGRDDDRYGDDVTVAAPVLAGR